MAPELEGTILGAQAPTEEPLVDVSCLAEVVGYLGELVVVIWEGVLGVVGLEEDQVGVQVVGLEVSQAVVQEEAIAGSVL